MTKGSFYWHFANREALLAAVLERWEQRETEQVIERVRAEPDPRRRIERLFTRWWATAVPLRSISACPRRRRTRGWGRWCAG